ncbi:hypothetical protein I547_2375 [Mycobacterium kansasii 824]|nr:hypothetical protein I547_2375 [Mycobacterium kansasii 824]KEP44738.1 hypothetical protein MKSMC1_01990 [Mycobacterium kansasii]
MAHRHGLPTSAPAARSGTRGWYRGVPQAYPGTVLFGTKADKVRPDPGKEARW